MEPHDTIPEMPAIDTHVVNGVLHSEWADDNSIDVVILDDDGEPD